MQWEIRRLVKTLQLTNELKNTLDSSFPMQFVLGLGDLAPNPERENYAALLDILKGDTGPTYETPPPSGLSVPFLGLMGNLDKAHIGTANPRAAYGDQMEMTMTPNPVPISRSGIRNVPMVPGGIAELL